ncbi:MAG: class I SAM-dependent methyltransferase [Planctomycetes bacterium]|nr:class I SAM-dependent methyltransferase [Planctomycetota bacterium]
MHAPRPARPPSATVPRRRRFTARTADRHELYQIAVQDPESDLGFLERAFRRWRKRTPYHFREDFCGTALLSATWAGKSAHHTAEGFDLDAATLAWGHAHNLRPLGDGAARVQLHQRDVRARGRRPADLRVAQNFSYMVFKERAELLEYFRAARADLARDGVFALDHYGGLEATKELVETRRCGGFTYVWEQARYLPGSGEYTCHIGFRFPDGSRLSRAFSYEWRYWHLTELHDLLLEAGFRDVHLYFEQGDADGEGSGEFKLDPDGRTSRECLGIVTYLIALP